MLPNAILFICRCSLFSALDATFWSHPNVLSFGNLVYNVPRNYWKIQITLSSATIPTNITPFLLLLHSIHHRKYRFHLSQRHFGLVPTLLALTLSAARISGQEHVSHSTSSHSSSVCGDIFSVDVRRCCNVNRWRVVSFPVSLVDFIFRPPMTAWATWRPNVLGTSREQPGA